MEQRPIRVDNHDSVTVSGALFTAVVVTALFAAGILSTSVAVANTDLQISPGKTVYLESDGNIPFSPNSTNKLSVEVDFGSGAAQGPAPWSHSSINGSIQETEWFYGQIGFQVSPDISLEPNGPPIEIVADTNGAVFASVHIEFDETGTLVWDTVGFEGSIRVPLDNTPVVFRNLLQNTGVVSEQNQLKIAVRWPDGSKGKVFIIPELTAIERTFQSPNAVSLAISQRTIEKSCVRFDIHVKRHKSSNAKKANVSVLSATGALAFSEMDKTVGIGSNGIGETSLCIPLASDRESSHYFLEVESIADAEGDTATSTYLSGVIDNSSASSRLKLVIIPAVMAILATGLLVWRHRQRVSA